MTGISGAGYLFGYDQSLAYQRLAAQFLDDFPLELEDSISHAARNQPDVFAHTINLTYACEISFKLLIAGLRLETKRVHELPDLFSILPAKNQQAIEQRFHKTRSQVGTFFGAFSREGNEAALADLKRNAPEQTKTGRPLPLNKVLSDCAKSYTRYRYFFDELGVQNGSVLFTLHIGPLFKLNGILLEYLKPHAEELRPNFQWIDHGPLE